MMTELEQNSEHLSEVGDPEVCTAALDETAASPSLPEKSPTKESARAADWKRRSGTESASQLLLQMKCK